MGQVECTGIKHLTALSAEFSAAIATVRKRFHCRMSDEKHTRHKVEDERYLAFGAFQGPGPLQKLQDSDAPDCQKK